MTFRPSGWWLPGAFALVLALCAAESHAAVPTVPGQPIRFSKPAVPLAQPAREQDNIPEVKERMTFNHPDMEVPMAMPSRQQPPPMIRKERRETEEDSMPRLFRTPKMFADPDAEQKAQDELANPFGALSKRPEQTRKPGASILPELFGQTRQDGPNELSPVTDFNWRPAQDKAGEKNNSPFNDRQRDAAEARRRAFDPFNDRDEAKLGAERMRGQSIFSGSSEQAKERLTTAQLQRRTDFEQLLNPNLGPAGKAPNSLQPVVGATDTKQTALAVPTLGGNTSYDPTTAGNPMGAFNRQNERLRGPTLDDPTKRYNPASSPQTSGSIDSRSQAPGVMRQYTREVPTRRGF